MYAFKRGTPVDCSCCARPNHFFVQALDDVQVQLDGLSSSCGAISSALATARATASGLLADADKATRELAAIEGKRQMVEQFLDRYQLTPEEVCKMYMKFLFLCFPLPSLALSFLLMLLRDLFGMPRQHVLQSCPTS